MIVQSAVEGEARFVIKMSEHTAFAGALAEHFGNAEFDGVQPRDRMLFVAANHDAGWADFDNAPDLDPETGLPFHLIRTPRPVTLETGPRSADFNQAHHPYCGLIASMHVWGLYNGRYGYSDHVLLSDVAEEFREPLQDMLDAELARQERLIAALRKEETEAPWVEHGPLFRSYKQLQFFDTLALYFNCTPEGSRDEARFQHVPRREGDDGDATIHVQPTDRNTYTFDPYPFDESPLTLEFEGRWLSPKDCLDGGEAAMKRKPRDVQAVTFEAA